MENYSKEFKELVEICASKGQYVGLGNPNSNILFIGKEAGIGSEKKKRLKDHSENANIWQADISNSRESEFSKSFSPVGNIDLSFLCNYNHTWHKYQKLYSLIRAKKMPDPKYRINFVEDVFTTELSNIPARTTRDARLNPNFKPELARRKGTFWKSEFIRQFPIVLIAAMDELYIQNHREGNYEINDIFGVEWKEGQIVTCKNHNQSFWIHHASAGKEAKLVIHTRQLTSGCSDELIELIADKIREFMDQKGIKLLKN